MRPEAESTTPGSTGCRPWLVTASSSNSAAVRPYYRTTARAVRRGWCDQGDWGLARRCKRTDAGVTRETHDLRGTVNGLMLMWPTERVSATPAGRREIRRVTGVTY